MRDIPGLTRQRMPSVRSPLREAWTPPPLSPRGEWNTGYFPRPTPGNVFDIDDFALPGGSQFEEPAFRTSSPITARTPLSGQRLPFEQAAANMHTVLQLACKEFPKIEKAFHEHTRALTVWLPPPLVDQLWTIYLDWNGIPLQQQRVPAPTAKPRDTATPMNPSGTFNDAAKRFSKALEGLKTSTPPAMLGRRTGSARSAIPVFAAHAADGEAAAAAVDWEILPTSLRKLQVSLDAIELLMGVVRERRDRMAPMVREMGSAVVLLEGMREAWDRKGETRPASSTNTVPSPQPPCMGGCSDPDHVERPYGPGDGSVWGAF
ncbi:Hypothetical predicted protein [Lecanosticta acicola]|uniref:Uncharacterized protein n=1 Tax=Lecanosticta acicola TaxID=111012 RepID=A0AAI8YZQ8_9PEZI|nr:Hypothetical predicted protein [Lecanosticta acicola]